MPSAIGLRFYKAFITEKGGHSPIPFDSSELSRPFGSFLKAFVESHAGIFEDAERERSWYFEEKNSRKNGGSNGLIHYGTTGFESQIIDSKTKKSNYARKQTDIEQVPLFYEFWIPKGEKFSLIAQQSFQGRSCIIMVNGRLKELFEKENPDFYLRISKLTPAELEGTSYFAAPVKEVTLISRKVSSDITDRLLRESAPESATIKLSISARRNGSLGPLSKLQKRMPHGAGAILSVDGTDFHEAVAKVKIGGVTRRVGVHGFNSDAGVIDVTDLVEFEGGHPTFKSVSEQADVIFDDLVEILRGFGS